MNPKLLQEIGLSEGETKVYLTLLKLGTTKTGPLAKKANVSSSKVYKILDRLEEKGLVGHIIKGKIKHYKAMEPKRVLDYIEQRQEQLNQKKELVKQILPELEQQQKIEETEATLFEGFKAVTNQVSNLLDELKSRESYYVLGVGYGETPAIRPFFTKYHKKRQQKKIKVIMLANHNERDKLVEPTKKLSEIKYLPQYLVTNMSIYLYNNKVLLAFWTQQPKGLLLESKEAYDSFKIYFDTLWKIAKN
ncbi:hypothetical protein COV18_02930 [Candidatus Woesearchaeota archaeon CG10_big_fil_rev_8_21_14_0_10_37_12]|nr:MAG: hypothetical protein COV18_02930 [Candidatus Woesearchaeota archaeon CG10_big_fil_rev_8_21_14_0_10_37_12]